MYDVNMKDINKIVEDVKGILTRTDFMISWYAKKYNKTIFRAGNMNKVGCKVWERNGDKYIEIWTRSHKGSIPECLYSDVKNIDIQKEEVDE